MTIDDAFWTDPYPFSADDPVVPPDRRRAWFLGSAPMPTKEPDADREERAAQLGHLPFLRWVHHVLDFIGDECRLTKQGALFAVDRKQLEKLCTAPSRGFAWFTYGTSPRVQLAWTVLTRHGWLARGDGWVRPTGKPLPAAEGAACTEEDLDGARRLLVAALEGIGTPNRYYPSTDVTDDAVLDALLVASGPEGLVLPDHLEDGALDRCTESALLLAELSRYPHIHEVPRDPRSGHVTVGAVRQLAEVSRAFEHLVDCGLVRVDGREDLEGTGDDLFRDELPGEGRPRVYRTPGLMRGVVEQVRAARAAGAEEARPYW